MQMLKLEYFTDLKHKILQIVVGIILPQQVMLLYNFGLDVLQIKLFIVI